ncbi:MAG TPA: hypothetical protein VJ508_07960, partial [Saprospiraceae bacterium]|nr:hypothetical protein [Saprospiraceae bacterium]
NEKKDSWNDDMCTRDFQKCDLNDKLFAVTYEHLDSVKGNFSTSKMIINRKTGHYSETYKFDGGSYKSEDLENGVCAPCSDPSNENGPSKF